MAAKSYILLVWCGFTILAAPVDSNPCGNWTAYHNETCVKLLEESGLQRKIDAENICKSLGENMHSGTLPTLVTVKTDEKLQFLHTMLFDELEIVDNVWLGLDLGNDSLYHWNDGTDMQYTNWADANADNIGRCVQMESGDGAYESGKWTKASCKKRNVVVCETMQPWSAAVPNQVEVEKRNKSADEEASRQNNIKQADELKVSRQLEAEMRRNRQTAKHRSRPVKGILDAADFTPVQEGFYSIQLVVPSSLYHLLPDLKTIPVSCPKMIYTPSFEQYQLSAIHEHISHIPMVKVLGRCPFLPILSCSEPDCAEMKYTIKCACESSPCNMWGVCITLLDLTNTPVDCLCLRHNEPIPEFRRPVRTRS